MTVAYNVCVEPDENHVLLNPVILMVAPVEAVTANAGMTSLAPDVLPIAIVAA